MAQSNPAGRAAQAKDAAQRSSLGKGSALLPKSGKPREARRVTGPRHQIGFVITQTINCHHFTNASVCLSFTKLRQNLCVGLKKDPCSVLLSLASSSVLVGMDAGLRTACQLDKSSSPGPSPPPGTSPSPQQPHTSFPLGYRCNLAPSLLHTLSPSLRWWFVSEQSHLHRYAFSEGFFSCCKKKKKNSGKNPSQMKGAQQRGGGRGGLCGAGWTPRPAQTHV